MMLTPLVIVLGAVAGFVATYSKSCATVSAVYGGSAMRFRASSRAICFVRIKLEKCARRLS